MEAGGGEGDHDMNMDMQNADSDSDPDADAEMPDAITLAVEAMTLSQRHACLAKDHLAVDKGLGHADLGKRYPRPVTITFRDSRLACDVRRGFALLPVSNHLGTGDATTGLEASKLCTHGSITQVDRSLEIIPVTKNLAQRVKRDLMTHWKTHIPVAPPRAAARHHRMQPGAAMYEAAPRPVSNSHSFDVLYICMAWPLCRPLARQCQRL